MMHTVTSTTILTSRIHFVKLPPHTNNNSFASSNLLLSGKMTNNKSDVSLTTLSKHHSNRCSRHKVINTDDGDDNDFTAELHLSEMCAFTTSKVTPEYRPIKVITSGFGSKDKLSLGVEADIGIIWLGHIIGRDLVAMNFNHIVSIGAIPTLFLTPRACPEQLKRGMKYGRVLCAGRCGFSIQFSDVEMTSSHITSSIGYGSMQGPILDGKNIEVGDVLIGLPSSGVHSHGFSLVRRVIEQSGSSLEDKLPGEYGQTIGDSLIQPTAVYVKEVLDIISKTKGGVKGIACIASGGFIENIPRLFRSGLGAVIFRDSWPVPSIFKWIQKAGRIKKIEMRRTFNMGIGMVLVMNKENASTVLEESDTYHIGEVVSGHGVTYR